MGSEHLVELWVSLFIAGEWDQMAFKGPFQPQQFNDSMIHCTVLLLPLPPARPGQYSSALFNYILPINPSLQSGVTKQIYGEQFIATGILH